MVSKLNHHTISFELLDRDDPLNWWVFAAKKNVPCLTFDEIQVWCKDHFGAESRQTWWSSYSQDTFAFKHEGHAMLFKIRWC